MEPVAHKTLVALHERLSAAERERDAAQVLVTQLQQALDAQAVALREARQTREAILAMVSHELRTPLNIILGNTEALCEGIFGPVSHPQHLALEDITTNGQRLLTLIANLLDMAQLVTGRLRLSWTRVDIPAVVGESVRQVQPLADAKQITIESLALPLVPALWADAHRLHQMLVHLLTNAVTFTPAGGQVGLSLTGVPATQMVQFSVWDTGIGIAPEDQERMFDLFVQCEQGLSRTYEGAGLGLALVAHLAAAHAGTVQVQSAPGQGSRFTIMLPWRTQPPVTTESPQSSDSVVTAPPGA